MTVGLLLLGFGASVAAFVAVLLDPRLSRRFKLHSLAAIGAFFAYTGVGILLILLLAPYAGRSERGAFLVALLFLGWIGYGTLWLTRLAPRTREPPAWMLRPWGTLDLVLLGTMAATIVAILYPP